jgi:nucleoside phosphorylase
MTALAEEASAFVGVLDDVTVHRYGGRDVHVARVGAQRIAIDSPQHMGNVSAGVTAAALLTAWRARRLLLVGIAGGIGANDVSFGDVVVPDQVVGYEPGKVRPELHERRPEVYRPDFELLTVAQSVAPAEWIPMIGQAAPDATRQPRAHFGTVLSGEKVIADVAFLDEVRAGWPKAVGVEMESFGTALAAYRGGGNFLMVKGISDLADAAKDDRWRAYALEAGARFAVALLRRLPAPSTADAVSEFTVSGPMKVTICRALVSDWRDVADFFGIEPYERARFTTGFEPQQVWEWLSARRRLRELPAALAFVGRTDLAAQMLGT